MISILFYIAYCPYVPMYASLHVSLHIGNMCLCYHVNVYVGNTNLYKHIKDRCANSKYPQCLFLFGKFIKDLDVLYIFCNEKVLK